MLWNGVPKNGYKDIWLLFESIPNNKSLKSYEIKFSKNGYNDKSILVWVSSLEPGTSDN